MPELEVGVQLELLLFTPIEPNKPAVPDCGTVVEGRVDTQEEEVGGVLAAEARVHGLIELARLLDVLCQFRFGLARDGGVACDGLPSVDACEVGQGCSAILKSDLVWEDVDAWRALRRLSAYIVRLCGQLELCEVCLDHLNLRVASREAIRPGCFTNEGDCVAKVGGSTTQRHCRVGQGAKESGG